MLITAVHFAVQFSILKKNVMCHAGIYDDIQQVNSEHGFDVHAFNHRQTLHQTVKWFEVLVQLPVYFL